MYLHFTYRKLKLQNIIIHKDLLNSTENSAQCYVAAWIGREFREEWIHVWASQVEPVVKNPPANAEDETDVGSIPGSDRSPGGGHGNPPQYSCLENPMDRGAWWATVYEVAKSRRQLSKETTTFTTCMNSPKHFTQSISFSPQHNCLPIL